MFDLSNTKKLKYLPYQGYQRPGVGFQLSENISLDKLRILLHTKYDLPDAYQLNGMISMKKSKEIKETHKIDVRKTISKRESTRKIPCTQYEYMTCHNIEDNKLILDKYNCQITAINYGQHLDNIIPNETSICSDEVAKKAIDLITSKKTNCTRAPTCEMTRFTFMVKDMDPYVENANEIWISFSNPEVANYNTYISYDLPSLIGEVGGILGLTLGVSALTFLESMLDRIPYY